MQKILGSVEFEIIAVDVQNIFAGWATGFYLFYLLIKNLFSKKYILSK